MQELDYKLQQVRLSNVNLII